jgi:hypothetical protein
VKYSTEEILGWVAKERDYQRLIGLGRSKRKLEREVAYLRKLLDDVEHDLDSESNGKLTMVSSNLRRVAANAVRTLERYGIPDQEMQKVRNCRVTIEREK